MSATRYLVLRRETLQEGSGPQPDVCVEVGQFDAASAEGALRQFGGVAGTYVATPARSWKPVVLTVEKVERVKFAAAQAADPKEAA